ncbi:MAG: hypothetical protein HXX08_11340 [Chloroflexi bacterium]|uniref:Uncharacterized protein n=1 Tax=Candidatus Chlorohelix allophototropha TaxID=3003348 RepID=A0A8T7LZE0_9CHLR|nr:hypothetical protein [Chloroflexota bacterium]WJW65831.1 hypothetical protein OZ401_001610 [Chloroflexota bacterium L227-S17]
MAATLQYKVKHTMLSSVKNAKDPESNHREGDIVTMDELGGVEVVKRLLELGAIESYVDVNALVQKELAAASGDKK